MRFPKRFLTSARARTNMIVCVCRRRTVPPARLFVGRLFLSSLFPPSSPPSPMVSRAALLALLVIVVCLTSAWTCNAKEVDVAAEAAARRAAISPEELARIIADNSISDADLLPTRPAPKNYVATGQPEFALLLSPGLGKGCNLKKYPNLRKFLEEDAPYYPQLIVDYAIAADPKIKFYATEEQRNAALIHGEFMSEEDILALLLAGPDESKEPILSLELMDTDPEPAELRYVLSQHRLSRTEDPNPDHSATVIFKEGFEPIED